MELVVSRTVCDDPTSWSFHYHWDEQVFWCLNYQLPMCIGWVIAYLNPKRLAFVWFYQWFFHTISIPQALSKLQCHHLPWIKRQRISTCAYRYIHMFCIFWEEWIHSTLLQSKCYWYKVGSKTMGIIMITHFIGGCPTNNLALVFMYFINYTTFACIDVKYHPI